MIKKIIAFFKGEEPDHVSAIQFKSGIQALGIERYKGISIFYIEMGTQPIYKFWRKKSEDIFSGQADTYEELIIKAHTDIDELLK